MRLDAVLQKTQKRGEASSKQLSKTYIAFADRPYDLLEENQGLEEISGQTGNKLETNTEIVPFSNHVLAINREQTGNDIGSIAISDVPIENKEVINNAVRQFEEQSNDFLQTSKQTGNKPGSNRKQSENKQKETPVITQQSIVFLVGLQRDALLFLYQECKRTRSEVTGAITLDRIGEHIHANQDVVKTTLRRIEKKGYVERVDFKNGRGGWTRYKMPNEVYQEILIMESDLFLSGGTVTSEKKELSELFVRTKEEVVQPIDKLPQEWQAIDISILSDIKFTKDHLFQIYKIGKFNVDNVQASINAFAFDLKENKKADSFKSGPLNFFMGILRKGSPYLPSENYESPEDKAMRQYVQYQMAKELKQKKLEKEAMELSFNDWEKELSNDDVLSICEGNSRANDRTSVITKGYLIKHFQENIWPERKESICLER